MYSFLAPQTSRNSSLPFSSNFGAIVSRSQSKACRNGTLPLKTQQRIGLGVAQSQGDEYAQQLLQRTARDAGLGLDEIALAKEFDSRDEREAALLRFIKVLVETEETPALHLVEEAREAGWTDDQILEAIAHVSLATFTNLITRAGNVPADGSTEDTRLLNAA